MWAWGSTPCSERDYLQAPGSWLEEIKGMPLGLFWPLHPHLKYLYWQRNKIEPLGYFCFLQEMQWYQVHCDISSLHRWIEGTYWPCYSFLSSLNFPLLFLEPLLLPLIVTPHISPSNIVPLSVKLPVPRIHFYLKNFSKYFLTRMNGSPRTVLRNDVLPPYRI